MSNLSLKQRNNQFVIASAIICIVLAICLCYSPDSNVESKPVSVGYSVTEDRSVYDNFISAQEGDYLVVEGDEWDDLAVKFHTTTKQLRGVNPGAKKLVPGEWINIPFPND